MEIRTFRQIYEGMKMYIIAHQKRLTDFNDGGVVSSLCEAVSRAINELYIRCRVGFSSYLRSLPYSIFGFEIKLGTKASATVRFLRSRAFSYDSPIPENSIVAAGNLMFITTSPGVVPSGEKSSSEISVIAEEVGEKYNIGTGAINRLVTTLSADIIMVTNDQPATGGTSKESWKEYVARFADYIVGLQRTNGAGFRAALLRGYVVRSFSIREHFPPVDDIWNMTVYLEDGTGEMPDLGIDLVKRLIDGDGSPENGGFRAPGINVRYIPPEKVFIDLEVWVKTNQDVTNEIDESVVIEDTQKKVKEYVNGLKIAKGYVKSDLTVILKRIHYLADVKIQTENLEIEDNQIIRYRSCEVIVEVDQ
jgi:hypothetical protein